VAYRVSLDGVDKPPSMQIQPEERWIMVGILFWLTRAYGQAVEGEATVERALDDAQQMFDRYRPASLSRATCPISRSGCPASARRTPRCPRGSLEASGPPGGI
jgi:hypothetical protein